MVLENKIKGRLRGAVGWAADFGSGRDLTGSVGEFGPLWILGPLSLPLPRSRIVSKTNKR